MPPKRYAPVLFCQALADHFSVVGGEVIDDQGAKIHAVLSEHAGHTL
jgi:hypothetical protein